MQEEFFKALLNLKSAAFQFEYIDAVGDTHTVWDDHIHTGELSELFRKSHELENEIREKLGAIGYEI